MKRNGYYGIGMFMPKTETNYWTLFRTAHILGADLLFLIGARFKRHSADTSKAYRHIPVYSYIDFQDFNSHRPYNCKLVGIELTEDAIEISKYEHPRRALYLLGAEDNGLSRECLDNCQEIIRLHGEMSMNVSVAGSIVLYDRYCKVDKKIYI